MFRQPDSSQARPLSRSKIADRPAAALKEAFAKLHYTAVFPYSARLVAGEQVRGPIQSISILFKQIHTHTTANPADQRKITHTGEGGLQYRR